MKFSPTTAFGALKSILVAAIFATELYAQNRAGTMSSASESSIFGSYGLYLGILAIGIFAAVVIKLLGKKARAEKLRDAVPEDASRLMSKGMDQADKNKRVYAGRDRESMPTYSPSHTNTGFTALPISSFVRLPRTSPYLQLPRSSEPQLRDAIEKTNEDSECDVVERTKALRVLMTYRTPNSIAAVAQVALYDLSTKLRAEAVSALAELDHESVFETIVTACADPSREVRAAAARSFVRIRYDRAESWTRIIESGDIGRMRHAARSAIEGGLVARSFDRLVHTDRNVVYEAYALTALLIRSGETEPIYQALASRRDENVKLALLHVLQTIKEDSTPEQLEELITRVTLTPAVAAKVNEIMGCAELTHA